VAILSAATSGSAAARTAPEGLTAALRTLAPRWTVPGPKPMFAWPTTGEGAVAVAGVGLVGNSPRNAQVPIASLTKMMTALVVLADHPLLPGQTGPSVLFSPEDVQDYSNHVRAGDSAVRVRAYESLTEYQLLEALLMPSGDNIADRLATWDAGSIPQFVVKMNTMADALALTSTNYADASGVDPRSASTAGDQALVASTLMTNPVIRGIVRQRRATFPVVGLIRSLNPALGIDGIIGVKGGFSSKARTCLVTAAFRSRHRVLVVSVALGQSGPASAARIDEALLEAATKTLERLPLTVPRAVVGTITAPGQGTTMELIAPRTPIAGIVWPGLTVDQTITTEPSAYAATPASARDGSVVALLTLSTPWSVLGTVSLRLAAEPKGPPRVPPAGGPAQSGASVVMPTPSKGPSCLTTGRC
jgi:D-alanyl-D-alanine carboxypeptidase (penicillin-binding protein 5/6)